MDNAPETADRRRDTPARAPLEIITGVFAQRMLRDASCTPARGPRHELCLLRESRRTARMTTKLEGQLKREIAVGDDAYTLTLSPDGFVLARKGRRKGLSIRWADLVSGEAALATALNASLTAPLEKLPERNNR
jgi:hypothetical protein